MSDAAGSAELRILTRLGIARLAIVGQLVLVLKRFRAAQLRDLEDALNALPDHVRAHIESHFDRKLDVKDELERYVQDLLKAIHLLRHLGIEGTLQRDVIVLFGALGGGGDRAQLLKMLQTLGAKLTRMLCAVCQQLSHITLQQEFYRVFAASENGLADLKSWMQWLDSIQSTPAFGSAVQFLAKCSVERCLALWLKLLASVASGIRVAIVERLVALNNGSLLKQIARFHDVTALPITKFMDLCEPFCQQLPMLLTEFAMATTLTLYAKFNDERLIASVEKALYLLGKGEVVRLIDTLALQESGQAIRVFFLALVAFDRRQEMAAVFLNMVKPSQTRLLDLLLRATAGAADGDDDQGQALLHDAENHTASITVFQFLLDGQLQSIDDALLKLWSLPASSSSSSTATLVRSMKQYTTDELVLLDKGVEVIAKPRCLSAFFRLFDMLLPLQRPMLVDWVKDMPGEDSLQIYDMLFALLATSQDDNKAATVLQMLASLKKSHKQVLCLQLLQPMESQGTGDGNPANAGEDMNYRIVFFLADAEPSRRRKCIKLLAAVDATAYDTLLFLLRTQRAPEQVALTKLMLSLSSIANGRLLAKIHGLDGETLDEFFQLLLLIPKIEYKMLARLLVSQEVTTTQFQDFVKSAANMMNQAASREMVIFAAELPAKYRDMFFAILAQCGPSEKGVLMRIVACSTRLAPEVLHFFVELLLRMPWETRSALVEQIRALEEATHIQSYVAVLRGFDDDTCLPRMIHLLNLLPLAVRIAVVPLFGQMPSIQERTQSLAKLNAMRKDQLSGYCHALCDPVCLPFISGAFLRVFGYLQFEFQAGVLELLKWRTCWVFIEVISVAMSSIEGNAAAVTSTPTSGDAVQLPTSNGALANGLAASLTLLKTEDDCVLLGDVMEEAMMGDAIRLEELIVVFAHFRDHERLLAFLKYVTQLTKCARSTLFFRVLSRSKATAFVFDVCHGLDLDDALFALKQLDHMYQRDADAVDNSLTRMAHRGTAVDARDEFCHFVLGYREQTPAASHAIRATGDRLVMPRNRPSTTSHQSKTVTSQREWTWDSEQATTIDGSMDPAVFSATAVRPVPVDKQLQRVQDKRENARRRCRRRRNWREWRDDDWEDALCLLPKGASAAVPTDQDGQALPLEEAAASPTSDTTSDLPTGPVSITLTPKVTASSSCALVPEATGQQCGGRVSPITTGLQLPLIHHQELPPLDTLGRPTLSSNRAQSLSRSESAPMTLLYDDSAAATADSRQQSKRYRGLHAALDLEPSREHHVSRDRGTSIFHRQCEDVNEHGPSRIRFARSEKARSKIDEARVQLALGRRSTGTRAMDTGMGSVTKPSLLRSEYHTIEQATAAITRGEQARTRNNGHVAIITDWIRKSHVGHDS